MKYRLINKDIQDNYAKELLMERGVKDIQSFLAPTIKNLQDFSDLDNINSGVALIQKTISDERPYAIIADSD